MQFSLGCNHYVLDKNYGGVLIIWDRLFGTFVNKRPETIVYSVVSPPLTFDPIKSLTSPYSALWNRLKSLPDWREKVQAVVKGPSWVPGSPWTGWDHLKPNVICTYYIRFNFLLSIVKPADNFQT